MVAMKPIVTGLSPDDVRTVVLALVDKWKPLLLLHEWDITVKIHSQDEDHMTEDAAAYTSCANPWYLRATIGFRDDYDDEIQHYETPEKFAMYLERLVIHELLHVRLMGLSAVVDHEVEDHSAEKRMFRCELEGAIECLSRTMQHLNQEQLAKGKAAACAAPKGRTRKR